VSVAPAEPAPTGDMVVSIDWAMTFDCAGPPLPFPIANWPGALHGVLGLNRDRSYSIELNYAATFGPPLTLRWQGRLGATPVQTRGGTAELRVGGPRSLRTIVHEPNNDLVFNVDADESGCRLSVNSQLHPGKTDYTLYVDDPRDEFRYAHCSAIRTVSATCTAR
jgi:hypothetical protein